MSPNEDPRNKYPRPPLPEQHQATQPGLTPQMHPRPDHGEDSYRGSGRLRGQRALITGVQHRRERDADIERAQMLEVFETNLVAPLILMREVAPHLEPGASVIVTASIQSFDPGPDLLDYAMTKAALVAFTRALAEEQAERGVRVNAVAPGPIWTPLIPATGWEEKQRHFGENTPLGRPGQPAELAGAYVYLASEDASYVSGAVLPVTGGRHP